MKKPPLCLLWCDLETTGLDSTEDDILEIALLRAPLANPFETEILLHKTIRSFPHEGIDRAVLEMHAKNGLWQECMTSTYTDDDFRVEMRVLLSGLREDAGDKFDPPILAGSTVHFDLAFLKESIGEKAFLHYRTFDVSTLKLFCAMRGVPLEENTQEPAHRALPDIVEAIESAQKCWRRLLAAPNVEHISR